MIELSNSRVDDEMGAMFGFDDENVAEQLLTKIESRKVPLAEVKTISNIGGERGLFSTCDIPAGSLILSEIPVIVWPECDLTEVENLVQVLRLVCSNQKAVDTTKCLHPRQLKHADSEELISAKETLGPDTLNEIAATALLEGDEVLRIFLTLQHNGFSSGLYEFLSIANHSCAPNCIKFMPLTRKNTEGTQVEGSGRHASEIWTTRSVSRGEELTICYCVPLEMTNRSMQSFLLQHHRFVCQCSKCTAIDTQDSRAISTVDNIRLFADITNLNAAYYSLAGHLTVVQPSSSGLAAMSQLCDYLSQEGLRMLSGHPPSSSDSTPLDASNSSIPETTIDDATSETVFQSLPTASVIPPTDNKHSDHTDSSDTTSAVLTYVENELEAMEGELLWYRAEDPANNLKTYTAMALAAEYLLAYFIHSSCVSEVECIDRSTTHNSSINTVTNSSNNNSSSNSSNISNSSVAQICARILKVSLSAATICLEMFEDIRSHAASEQSRSHHIVHRLKCKKYVEHIKIDKLLFPYIVEVMVKNSLMLLQFQRQYLGDLHSDLATTYSEIVQGLELLTDNFSVEEVGAFWSLLSDKNSLMYTMERTSSVTVKATTGTMSNSSATTSLTPELVKRYKQQGERVRALYSTARRFPEALTGSRQPGAVYWGSKQALEKLSSTVLK